MAEEASATGDTLQREYVELLVELRASDRRPNAKLTDALQPVRADVCHHRSLFPEGVNDLSSELTDKLRARDEHTVTRLDW